MIISQELPKKLMDIRYTEEEIIQLAKKNAWKGIGAENDPIIIPSNEDLPQKFAILQSKLYINLRDCTFEHVDLYRCWNISAENSSFNHLYFIYSFRNMFTKCQIDKLEFSFSSGNKFKECNVPKISQIFGKKNQFEDCNLTKKARKRLGVDLFNPSDFMKILPTFILLLCFFPLFWIFEALFSSMPLGFNLLIPILLILIVLFMFISLSKIKNLSRKSSKSNKNR